MPPWFIGKFRTSICFTVVLAFLLPTLFAPVVQAQAATDGAPAIDLHQVEQGVAGEVQVFTVEVENVVDLSSVDFLFRFAGESEYRNAPMTLLDGTSVYTAYIDTDAADVRAIEYYIQAIDGTGNRLVKGFTFEPFVRTMIAGEPAVTAAVAEPELPLSNTTVQADSPATSPVSEQGSGLNKKWLWGIAGLVLVAVVASSLASDDPDDDSPDPLSLQVQSRAVFSW